jgi:hypothetical protein
MGAYVCNIAIFKKYIILFREKAFYATFVSTTPLVTFFSGLLFTHVLIMMIDSKIYRGIEYVHISELPKTQREALIQTINHDLFIKILIDGNILHECLQFKDYSFWYNSVFVPKTITAAPDKVKEVTSIGFNAKELVFK